LRRGKAARPATDLVVNRPPAVFQAGRLEDPDATPLKYTFQAITLTAGRRVIGHVMPCGRAGFRAYDEADRLIGTFPTMKAATAAVDKAAA
jgi:hypothetical protein